MSGQFEVPLPEPLARQFAALQTQVRNLTLLRGLGMTTIVAAAALGAALLADLQWDLSAEMRVALLAAAGLLIAATALFTLVRPLFRRMTLAELAAVVEQAHPRLAERLLSTVELNDPALPDEYKGSAYMRAALNRQTLRASGRLQFADSISPKRSLRIGIVASVALLGLLAPLLWSPSGYGHLWGRMFDPWGNRGHGFNLYFDVAGGDRTVARGDDVTIRAEPRWRAAPGAVPRSVRLNWTADAGASDSRLMEFDATAGAYTATLPRVPHPLTFHISAPQARSRDYRIDVADRPEIVAATLDADPPAYTGRPAATHDGIVGEIPVFERSRLRFRLEFNKPVDAAELVWLQIEGADTESKASEPTPDEPLRLTLTADRRQAAFEWTALHGGPFAFHIRDEHGLVNADEPLRRILFTPDLPPRLEVAGSQQPRQARPSDSVPVGVTAADDVGLGALELHYEIGRRDEPQTTAVDQALLGPGPLSHDFTLDLAALGLQDGDVLTYKVRAADERPVPKPNEVWSEPRTITVSRDAPPPGLEELARQREQQREELEQIREELDENRERVADLERDAADALREGSDDFDRNAELPPLAREQNELAQKLEDLSQRLGRHPLFADLMQQAQQLAREALAQGSSQLQQAAAAELPEKAAALNQNAADLDGAEEQLQQLQQQFDELAALERDLMELERLAQQAEQLANRAGAPGENPQSADERQALQQEQSALADLLEELLQRRPEILDAARQDQLNRLSNLADEARRLAQSQEQLAESVSQQPAPSPDGATAAEAASQVAEAQERQRNLTEQAAALAMNVARQAGPESPATQEATQTAREADQAGRELDSGELSQASERLQQAAKSASETAEELAESGPELAEQAQELAQELAAASTEMQELSQSPSACRACRQASQQGLAGAASVLGRKLAEAGERMQSSPLNQSPADRQASEAGAAAAQAAQAMSQAAQQIADDQSGPAAESGRQAAADLNRAAELAAQAASQQPGESPVPPSLAGQVADAARHLAEAQRQLAENGNPQQGQPSAGQPPSASPQPSQGEPGSSGPQSALAQALQQAAQALAQAAQQVQSAGGPLSPDAPPGEGAGNGGTGAIGHSGIELLDSELQRLASSREWGQLSSELRTEILQAARKRPHGEYAHLIRLYFEEIAKAPEGEPRE